MTKRDFIIQFVLNRASAGHITTDGVQWVMSAEKAWELIQESAPSNSFPPGRKIVKP